MIDADEQRRADTAPQPPIAGVALAAERWISEHGDALWRFVLARTRSHEATEEVVQETLLAAMEAHASFAGGSSERTWLLGIANHKVADHFRRARRSAPASDTATAGANDPDSLFTPSGKWITPPARTTLALGRSPGEAASDTELLATLRKCLDALPPALAEAVTLRDLMGMPVEDVCKAIGLTPTNLWSRTHRARAALRLCVERASRKEGTR